MPKRVGLKHQGTQDYEFNPQTMIDNTNSVSIRTETYKPKWGSSTYSSRTNMLGTKAINKSRPNMKSITNVIAVNQQLASAQGSLDIEKAENHVISRTQSIEGSKTICTSGRSAGCIIPQMEIV